MKIHKGFLCLVFIFFSVNSVWGQVLEDKGTLSGLVYSDYYWFANSHNEEIAGNNGFWFRRIYLTYDQPINDSFSARLRLEMNSPGDFLSDDKMTPVLKDAYLKWANENHEILAGISSTPMFGLIEDIWGYRSVEKTPQDLYGFGSSRDFGLSFKGTLDAEQKAGYHLFVGNGNSNKPELDQGKKIMLSLSYELTDHFVVQAYGDWDDRPDDQDWTTLQGFAGYQSEAVNLGASYSYQIRNNSSNTFGDIELDLVSLFANATLTDMLKGYIRVDHLFDPVVEGESISYLPMSSSAESSTFLVGGVDISLAEDIHLMPNIETIVYGEDETGNRPDEDIVPRMTLFYEF